MLIAVVGPTASGKSVFALELAQALGGNSAIEIVGADAFQLYRGMDIGTAKLVGTEQRGFVHHQIDVLDIFQEASVAAYQRHARENVENILERDKTPILVGGSGLYVRALLDRIEFPGTDPNLRKKFNEELEVEGPEVLHLMLRKLDPKAAVRIDPRNGRRIVRALEVIELTGKPFSASLPEYRYQKPTVQIGLQLPIEVLDRQIEHRTKKMFKNGLVEEVRELAKKGLGDTKTASRATGYSQVLDMLLGKLNQTETVQAVTLATRQLVRRQLKWFRRDPRIMWIDPNDQHNDPVNRALQIFCDAKDAEPFL